MKKLFLYAGLFFLYFLGHGSYFSTLSPYMLDRFSDQARYIFLAGQIAFPAGYFLAGYLSDKKRKLRIFLILGLLFHAPCQFFLFSDVSFYLSIPLSAITRFLFAFNMQILTIATIEGVSSTGFARSRTAGTVGFLIIHLALFGMQFFRIDLPFFEFGDTGSGGRAGSFFLFLLLVPVLMVQKDRLSSVSYHFKDAIHIAKRPDVFWFYFLSFVFFTSYQIVDFYLGAYLKLRGGLSYVYLGWIFAVSLEIVLLPLTFRMHSESRLFIIGLAAGLTRFVILFVDSTAIRLEWVLISQFLHGIHFTCYYMGAIYRLRDSFPEHLYGTGYGMYMALSSALGQIAGNLGSGFVLGKESIHGNLVAENYGSIFGYAIIVHILVMIGFYYLPGIGKGRQVGKETL